MTRPPSSGSSGRGPAGRPPGRAQTRAPRPRRSTRRGRPDGAGRAPAVLVAEDVGATRHAVAMILSAQGYRVLEAEDGRQAVEIARLERPAAVLMDIAMPSADGISALDRLRGDPETADIPVAAVTACAMPDDRRRIEAAGFDAMLVKPFRISQLLSLLDGLLPSGSTPRAS